MMAHVGQFILTALAAQIIYNMLQILPLAYSMNGPVARGLRVIKDCTQEANGA